MEFIINSSNSLRVHKSYAMFKNVKSGKPIVKSTRKGVVLRGYNQSNFTLRFLCPMFEIFVRACTCASYQLLLISNESKF